MGRIRVLIADPDRLLLSEYEKFLSGAGFEVMTATSGLDCVAQLRGFQPDVLVLEPELPWGWGDGVLALMQEGSDVPLVPVMILSAPSGVEELPRAATFPIWEYQVKPLAPQQLAQRLRRLLDQMPLPGGFFG